MSGRISNPINPNKKKRYRLSNVKTFSEFVNSPLAKQDHYLLFGNPVGHSLSPVIHSLALLDAGIQATYSAVTLLPEEITAAIAWMHQCEYFQGANVTIPYKQSFMEVVDECGEEVLATGALNTLRRDPESGFLTAVNTDIEGFLAPIEVYMDRIAEAPVLIFGSGGAARAVVYALLSAGAEEIVLVSRRPEDAKHGYRGEFDVDSGELQFVGYDQWMAFAEDAFLLVNATPAGMLSFPVGCPVPIGELGTVCSMYGPKLMYDLVYNPYDTPFLIEGHRFGSDTCHGVEMFLHQAAASFRFWTGCEFPLDLCRKELERRLYVG